MPMSLIDARQTACPDLRTSRVRRGAHDALPGLADRLRSGLSPWKGFDRRPADRRGHLGRAAHREARPARPPAGQPEDLYGSNRSGVAICRAGSAPRVRAVDKNSLDERHNSGIFSSGHEQPIPELPRDRRHAGRRCAGGLGWFCCPGGPRSSSPRTERSHRGRRRVLRADSFGPRVPRWNSCRIAGPRADY